MKVISLLASLLLLATFINSQKVSVRSAPHDIHRLYMLKAPKKASPIVASGGLSQNTSTMRKAGRCGVINDGPLAYSLEPPWKKKAFTWKLMRGYLPSFGEGRTRAILYESFADWARYAPISFQEVAENGEADFVISFVHRYHDPIQRFDGSGGNLAYAYLPPSGVINFESEEDWTETYTDAGFNLRLVATHEIGHALGLAHSYDPLSIMFERYQLMQPAQLLPIDDQRGIQSLYGSRPSVTRTKPTTTTRRTTRYTPPTTRRTTPTTRRTTTTTPRPMTYRPTTISYWWTKGYWSTESPWRTQRYRPPVIVPWWTQQYRPTMPTWRTPRYRSTTTTTTKRMRRRRPTTARRRRIPKPSTTRSTPARRWKLTSHTPRITRAKPRSSIRTRATTRPSTRYWWTTTRRTTKKPPVPTRRRSHTTLPTVTVVLSFLPVRKLHAIRQSTRKPMKFPTTVRSIIRSAQTSVEARKAASKSPSTRSSTTKKTVTTSPSTTIKVITTVKSRSIAKNTPTKASKLAKVTTTALLTTRARKDQDSKNKKGVKATMNGNNGRR